MTPAEIERRTLGRCAKAAAETGAIGCMAVSNAILALVPEFAAGQAGQTQSDPSTPAHESAPVSAATQQDPELQDMCPNCITPWKCNGPHIPQSPAKKSKGSSAMPKHSWQIPVSCQRPGKEIAHLFKQSKTRNKQVLTACGKMVTPGFARPAGSAKRCELCEKRHLLLDI